MSISKKIFIISSVLLASVLFFIGIYNVSFKQKEAISQTPVKENQSASQAASNSASGKNAEAAVVKNKEKIYALTDEAAVGPVVTDDEMKIEYYSKDNGNVYKVLLDGEEKETISNANLQGIENALWSFDESKVLVRSNIGGKIRYSSYDYSTKKGQKLSEGMEYAVWNNLTNQIVYKYFDAKTGKRTINIANLDGSNWKKIADILITSPFIASIPQYSFVSFWNNPNAFEETSLDIVSALGGDVKKIFSGKFGADYLWSPDGTKALVSFSDSKGGSKISLGTINSNGGEFQNLNIPTFVSKCVWGKNSKTIYYALPTFSSSNYVLPNDYQSGKISSRDTFWKMDLSSGKAERIVEVKDISGSYDAKNLFLSKSEDMLFFINKTDGKLYGISL